MSPRVQALQQGRREERLDHYREVWRRRQEGQTIERIADEVGLSKRTVQRFLRVAPFPERQERQRSASSLDPYKDYLQERWRAGCRNGARLHREIQEHGYQGGYGSVYAWLRELHGAEGHQAAGAGQRPRRARVRRRKWRVLLSKPAAQLTTAEAQQVAQVCAASAELGTVYELVQEFGHMGRERQRMALDSWLERARSSGIAELARFARGLQRDYAAVAAALELTLSNRPTEGHVNRLKYMKRSMFGRAKFDLLRKRVLCLT